MRIDPAWMSIGELGQELAHRRLSCVEIEQLAIKMMVPVIALSSDQSLTANNVPWIFRLSPETSPAAALRLIRVAEGQSGLNPERLRDVLASGNPVDGIVFLPTGEPKGQ